MGFGYSFRDGDWPRLRQIIQKLSSLNVGPEATPTFAGLTISGDLTTNTLTITESAQDWLFGTTVRDTAALAIIATGSGAISRVVQHSADGDGTDNVLYELFGVGTAADINNRELLQMGWLSGSEKYVVRTLRNGFGDSRPLVLSADASLTQMVLEIGGNVSFANTVSANMLNASRLYGADNLIIEGEDVLVLVANTEEIRITSESSYIRILAANVLDIIATDGNLTLTATDDNIDLVANVGINLTTATGGIAIDAGLILDITATDGDLTLTAIDDNIDLIANVDINLTAAEGIAIAANNGVLALTGTDGVTIDNGLAVNTTDLVVNATTHQVSIGPITGGTPVFQLSGDGLIFRMTETGATPDTVWDWTAPNNSGLFQWKRNNVIVFAIRSNGNIGFGGEYLPETLLEMTSTEPYLTLHNSTQEDIDGGRESQINFKGEQGVDPFEETTLARIEVSHDGTGADDKGKFVISVNDGNDGDTPTDRFKIDAAGVTHIGDGTNEMQISATGDLSFAGTAGLIYGHMDVPAAAVITIDTSSDGNPVEVADDGTASVGDGWESDYVNGTTFAVSNLHYITVNIAGTYEVIWDMSVKTNAAQGTVIHGGITVDTTTFQRDNGEGHAHVFNNNDDINICSVGVVDCPNGTEEISLWISNDAGQKTVVEHGNMSIKMIGGT